LRRTALSRSKIDRSGAILSDFLREYDEQSLEMEMVFDEYRKLHLEPLTKFTLEVQAWLQAFSAVTPDAHPAETRVLC
jgi:hypothetical protein